MMKNKIVLFAMMLLLSTVIGIQPVFADEVHIEVDMNGNAYIYIQNTDGTLTFIYNGRDVLLELGRQYDQLALIVDALGQEHSGLKEDFDELYIDVGLLIGDLGSLLDDLYGKVNFLAHVIGINPGDSSIVETLVSGNSTIVDYLDDIFLHLDTVDMVITELLQYTEERFNFTRTRLEFLEDQIDASAVEEANYRRYLEDRLLELSSSLQREANYRITVDDHLRDTQEYLRLTQTALFASIGLSIVIAIALVYVFKRVEAQ